MEKINSSDVAIVIPLSTRNELNKIEKISLVHLREFMGKYDKFYAVANKVNFDNIDSEGIEIQRFPNKYFGSVKNYNKLMSSKRFYKAFKSYKYVLIYHLDALVFSDQLMEWCNKGYDLIAPPWIKKDLGKWGEWMQDMEFGVGNGGFSLRKPDRFLEILNSKVYWESPKELSKRIAKKIPVLGNILGLLLIPFASMNIFNNVRLHRWYFIKYKGLGEDRFFGLFAKHYVKDFKLPDEKEAISFAFEKNPERLYEFNNRQLPFGCHKFEREIEFWEPFFVESAKKIN